MKIRNRLTNNINWKSEYWFVRFYDRAKVFSLFADVWNSYFMLNNLTLRCFCVCVIYFSLFAITVLYCRFGDDGFRSWNHFLFDKLAESMWTHLEYHYPFRIVYRMHGSEIKRNRGLVDLDWIFLVLTSSVLRSARSDVLFFRLKSFSRLNINSSRCLKRKYVSFNKPTIYEITKLWWKVISRQTRWCFINNPFHQFKDC